MAKAILCKAFGPHSTLVLDDIDCPPPGPGEVLVAVKACSVNFPDTLIVQGKYQYKPQLPFSPGCEISGVIKAVGEGVSAFAAGDRVAGFPGWGGYAEEIVMDAKRLAALPARVAFDVAACVPLTYGTSHYALCERAGLKSGETLLVLGAAGGVGLAAVEIGKVLGARVIACASSDDKLAVCREYGADETVNYSRQNLKDAVKDLTAGAGADVVYDPVGGELSELALRATAWQGRHLVIGFAAGEIPKIPLNLPLLKGCSLVGVFWGSFVTRSPEQNRVNLDELFRWVAEGRLHPRIDERFALDEAIKALDVMSQRGVRGKLVLEVGQK